MTNPYTGEIRIFAGNFPPAGWAFCDGQPMAISENEVLFQLIGTTYGGDGEETFVLPDLRGRLPVHQGQGPGLPSNRQIGENGGSESVTLSVQQLPSHSHTTMGAAVTGDQTSANGALPANSVTITPYVNTTPGTPFNAGSISPAGGSQPHDNMQPYACVNFIIALYGVFPSQT